MTHEPASHLLPTCVRTIDTQHRGGARNQASSSSSKPGHFGQRFQTVSPGASSSQVKDLIDAYLNASGEELKRIESTVDLIAWIHNSNFLRSQQREPLVGDGNCPSGVEQVGIKGQSAYTALFDNDDRQIYSCKMCPHMTKDDLEGAITHLRNHFRHCPFQCSGTQAWYVSFSLLYESVSRTFSIQRTALRKPSGSGGTPARYWALSQESEMFCDIDGLCQDAGLCSISIGVTLNYHLCLIHALYSSQTPCFPFFWDWTGSFSNSRWVQSITLRVTSTGGIKATLSNAMFGTGLRALNIRPSHNLFYGSCIDASSLVDPTEQGTIEFHKIHWVAHSANELQAPILKVSDHITVDPVFLFTSFHLIRGWRDRN